MLKIIITSLILIIGCNKSIETEYFQGSNAEYEAYLDIFFSQYATKCDGSQKIDLTGYCNITA